MVYSQICSWLDDYLQAEPPEELLDPWDFHQWINETGIVAIFQDYIKPSYTSRRARNDATQILMTLLWEYYLFRRNEPTACSGAPLSIKDEYGYIKRDVLTSSEFSHLFDTRNGSLIRSKIGNLDEATCKVSTGQLNAADWIYRSEPILKQLYTWTTGLALQSMSARKHPLLDKLVGFTTATSDGRLVIFSAPMARRLEPEIIPDEFYHQIQVLLEIYDVENADYYECRLGSAEAGPCCVVAVVGDKDAWTYEYSPIFEGHAEADTWVPAGQLVERTVLGVLDSQRVQFRRNRRWWSTVGLPEYNRFWSNVATARKDPMYFMPCDEECLIVDSP